MRVQVVRSLGGGLVALRAVRRRLVVAFDDPLLDANFISVGPDRLYLTVERRESDIWVARLRS